MENKKNDQKPGFPCNQHQNKVEKSQANNVSVGPSANVCSPSDDSSPNSNQQQQPQNVQWSFTPQNAFEQFMAMHFPNQAPTPAGGALNQWQQGQVFAQSAAPPFWQPQPPTAGNPLLGGSSAPYTMPPNMCYPLGYSFPGFPGPWDPSSCLGQLYQIQHPYVYGFPGAINFPSATPAMPGCVSSGEQSSQRGISRPHAKLSQKHQQLWDAQSVENVKLWSVIKKLQAEVSDYKDQLKKLEEEVLSLKRKVDVPANKVIGTIPAATAQPSKRGRPRKRSLASVDALLESHSQADGKNPALRSTKFECKSPIFEKVVLKKVENKDIAIRSTSSNEKILNAVKDESSMIQINKSNPIVSAYQSQVDQGIQKCGSGTAISSSSGINNLVKDKDMKLAYSQPSQSHDKALNASIGNPDNVHLGWTSGMPSQGTAMDLLDFARQSFFLNGSFIQQQGGSTTPGWNFANDDASGVLEDAIVGSAKDESEEEMGDETSSGGEELGVTKDIDGCSVNFTMATSP
ncbi:hypothetical protein RJT34_05616 [Clitoria ternatea]|uniref:Uncharacterized protein n=1 Tax=Clitoria ternatea TaxID=43366 RepID=A0AAN9PSP4_CLITE